MTPSSVLAHPSEFVPTQPLEEITRRAVELLKLYEPPEGYYLAFSGGKDSCTCKKLLQMAGVKFDAWYNNTTIDPPELVRFIKTHHPDVGWNQPKHGNMMTRVAERPSAPPTRAMRWCCAEYKEGGGDGRVKVIGVRRSESKARRAWTEFAKDKQRNTVICPIVFWTEGQVWEFIKKNEVPYCELYDKGWDRLGCVGCPLVNQARQTKEFLYWPKYEANWKRAVVRNWEKWHDKPNTRTGEPRFHARFKDAEEFWRWWRYGEKPPQEEECQGDQLLTNVGD